jgi:hypothetical protein
MEIKIRIRNETKVRKMKKNTEHWMKTKIEMKGKESRRSKKECSAGFKKEMIRKSEIMTRLSSGI